MLKIPVKYVDQLNTLLIIFSCALAHFFPYHLLIFSYAVLGPAHYLTQISWLHDRCYFANSNHLIAPMALLSLFMVILPFYTTQPDPTFVFAALFIAAAIAMFSITPPDSARSRILVIATTVFLFFIALHSPAILVFIAFLLPTVIHVFVFTACFMWVGARKSGQLSAYVSFATLIFCAVTFFILPPLLVATPKLYGISYFRPVSEYLQKIFFSSSSETQIFGFLSFAYTYHYLNWFSKAEVIHWNKISSGRIKIILITYTIFLLLFICNFALGFLAALLLSIAHVLLEFPLNLRTFALMARGKA